MIYQKAFDSSFHGKLKSLHYNASLEKTRAVRGTSKKTFPTNQALSHFKQDNGIENCAISITFMFLNNLCLTFNYRTRNADDMPHFNNRHNFSKNSFFPSAVIEWNKLDSRLQKAESFTDFKKNILSFIRTKASSTFNCNSSKRLKFVTRLHKGLIH